MPRAFRYALCNELFGSLASPHVFGQIKQLGYDGLEIAPFTLGDDPAGLTISERRMLSQGMKNAGLDFVGLHWLLAAPPGLHATTPDQIVRERTWEYIARLVDLTADLSEGGGGVMVFGSPKQRSTVDGTTPEECKKRYTEHLSKVAPYAQERGVKILVEALPVGQSDVITSIQEAATIVDQIGSPAVQTMFDVHNAIDETESHRALIQKYAPKIAHVHVNENDGREPGTGSYPFGELSVALRAISYNGWVSLEVFDFSRDPATVAGNAIKFLESQFESNTL